ncbi:unnamed protein product [Arctogadus glacialis]
MAGHVPHRDLRGPHTTIQLERALQRCHILVGPKYRRCTMWPSKSLHLCNVAVRWFCCRQNPNPVSEERNPNPVSEERNPNPLSEELNGTQTLNTKKSLLFSLNVPFWITLSANWLSINPLRPRRRNRSVLLNGQPCLLADTERGIDLKSPL